MTHGLYRVTGKRNHRGHPPGSTFVARLDRQGARLAVERGDIELLQHVSPGLKPGSYTFPRGWLPAQLT